MESPKPQKRGSPGRWVSLAARSMSVPSIIEVRMNVDLNRPGSHRAATRGQRTAVARSPSERNPKSLRKEPVIVVDTVTATRRSKTMMRRVCHSLVSGLGR